MRKKPRSSSRTAQARTLLAGQVVAARGRARRARAAPAARGRSASMSSNFCLVAALAPARVVEVLLAAALRRCPVAWMWPPGYGQIHTSCHAGGMTSSWMRPRTSASVDPLARRRRGSSKPLPRRRRRDAGRRRCRSGAARRGRRGGARGGLPGSWRATLLLRAWRRLARALLAPAPRFLAGFFAAAFAPSSACASRTASRLAFSAAMRSGTGVGLLVARLDGDLLARPPCAR